MKSSDCKKFEICDAPLCPLDKQSLEHGIWYPDEAICDLRGCNEVWLKTQKKIAKVETRADRYFNLEMLSRLHYIRKGIEGLDPDSTEATQLKKWLKLHPDTKARLPQKTV